MTRQVRVRVDRDRCSGTTNCANTAGDTFSIDVEGKSVPVPGEVELTEDLADAVDLCPVQAIWLVDPDSGETVDASVERFE